MGVERFSVKGKVAIVTGSARGIGRGIALEFAEAGADVVVTGLNVYDQSKTEADLEAVVSEVRKRGSKAIAVPCDFRVAGQVGGMVDKAVKAFGVIDILVNNVGGTFYAPFVDLTESGLNAVLKENLVSNFLTTHAVVKTMLEQKRQGNIVNIASISGFLSSANLSHYGASKAGVISLTKSLAIELAPHHIRVNAVAPGLTEHEGTVGRPYKDQQERAKMLSGIPLGHAGKAQDIAAAALYLASDAAYQVTGVVIPVDGGASIKWG